MITRRGLAGLGKDTVRRVHFGVFSTSHFFQMTGGVPTDCGKGGGEGINKTISDRGITADFWIIKVHTSN